MTIATYLHDMLSSFSDRRITRNITTLVQRIIEGTSLRLWSISDNKQEFERHKHLLDGSLKSELDAQSLSDALRAQGAQQAEDQEVVVFLHDPCDIRKPYATDLENLGTVRSLDGKRIPGYSSFESVLVDERGRHPQPFDMTIYSNGDPRYVTEEELSFARQGTLDQKATAERAVEVRQAINEDTYVNLNRVVRAQLRRISHQVKATMPDKTVWHILDRQFDGEPYFRFIDQELNDVCLIRLKANRNSQEWTVDDETGTVRWLKLTECVFAHQYRESLSTLRIKNTTYQNVTRVLEWDTLTLSGTPYTVVRVTLLDRTRRPLYRQPMLLLTNVAVFGVDDAREIYRLYLLRAKIEGVFKFCKQVLGWETFQVRDYRSICNLLALGFFVVGYFYLIDSALICDPVLIFICALGGGKGLVTRHFFVLGIQKLLVFRTVEHMKRMWELTGREWEDVVNCIC